MSLRYHCVKTQSGPDTLGKGRPAADEMARRSRAEAHAGAQAYRGRTGHHHRAYGWAAGSWTAGAEWVLLAPREEAHDLLGACFDGHDACVQFEGVRHVVKDLGVLASREAGRTVAA